MLKRWWFWRRRFAFFICPVHGDVLRADRVKRDWIVNPARLRSCHPFVPRSYRARVGQEAYCPVGGCGAILGLDVRDSDRAYNAPEVAPAPWPLAS